MVYGEGRKRKGKLERMKREKEKEREEKGGEIVPIVIYKSQRLWLRVGVELDWVCSKDTEVVWY